MKIWLKYVYNWNVLYFICQSNYFFKEVALDVEIIVYTNQLEKKPPQRRLLDR